MAKLAEVWAAQEKFWAGWGEAFDIRVDMRSGASLVEVLNRVWSRHEGMTVKEITPDSDRFLDVTFASGRRVRLYASGDNSWWLVRDTIAGKTPRPKYYTLYARYAVDDAQN